MGAAKIVGRRALIGRGFLGTVLDQPGRFTDRYNSTNIHELNGDYDLIVIAAPHAEKWWANENPVLDCLDVEIITSAIQRATCPRIILLSSIDAGKKHPYGQNRVALERLLPTHARIIRLGALFGDGLRKNALYDLLHNRPVADGIYQWTNVNTLWKTIQPICTYVDPKTYRRVSPLYSEPLSMRDIARALELKVGAWNEGEEYNEKGPYTMDREEALRQIVEWVTSTRRPATSPPCACHQGQACQSGECPGGTYPKQGLSPDGPSEQPPTQSVD